MKPTAEQALASLGESAETVAQELRRKKITGLRCSSYECPIAVFLERETGCRFSAGTLNAYSGRSTVDLPGAVSDFIVKFDMGCYPELE